MKIIFIVNNDKIINNCNLSYNTCEITFKYSDLICDSDLSKFDLIFICCNDFKLNIGLDKFVILTSNIKISNFQSLNAFYLMHEFNFEKFDDNFINNKIWNFGIYSNCSIENEKIFRQKIYFLLDNIYNSNSNVGFFNILFNKNDEIEFAHSTQKILEIINNFCFNKFEEIAKIKNINFIEIKKILKIKNYFDNTLINTAPKYNDTILEQFIIKNIN